MNNKQVVMGEDLSDENLGVPQWQIELGILELENLKEENLIDWEECKKQLEQ